MDISLTFMIKIPQLTPLFFTGNGPKTDLFAIFWLWKIILGYLRFCDQNHFWSKVAYEYKLDIHEKKFHTNATFSTVNGPKTDFFAIFWLCKIILGYFWFCVQNYYWSKVFLGSNYSVSIRNPFVSASFWLFLGRKDHLMNFLTFLTTFEGPYRPERGKKLKFLLAKPVCLGSHYSVSIRNSFVSASFCPFLGS